MLMVKCSRKMIKGLFEEDRGVRRGGGIEGIIGWLLGHVVGFIGLLVVI